MIEENFYLFIRSEINIEAQKTYLAVNLLWKLLSDSRDMLL